MTARWFFVVRWFFGRQVSHKVGGEAVPKLIAPRYFIIYVRSPKVKQWCPMNIVSGSEAGWSTGSQPTVVPAWPLPELDFFRANGGGHDEEAKSTYSTQNRNSVAYMQCLVDAACLTDLAGTEDLEGCNRQPGCQDPWC